MIGKDITIAIELLKKGEVVALPTETVYGLAGNAFDEKAVLKIFKVKNRPFFDPLIVHVDSIEKMKNLVIDFPEKAKLLAEKFSPGPLTLVLKKSKQIPDLVTAGNDTVAVRIPNHPLILKVLKTLDFPLAAPSANPFGYISPTTAQHVDEQLGKKIPYILDGGNCAVGIESTIVSFAENVPRILRLGGLSKEKIESIISKVEIEKNINETNPAAPGQLASHYSPKHLLVFDFTENDLRKYPSSKVGVISFNRVYPTIPVQNQFQLSINKDPDEAAKNLFSAMRQLDKMNLEIIFAEKFPEEGLGKAINDRLMRAAAKK